MPFIGALGQSRKAEEPGKPDATCGKDYSEEMDKKIYCDLRNLFSAI